MCIRDRNCSQELASETNVAQQHLSDQQQDLVALQVVHRVGCSLAEVGCSLESAGHKPVAAADHKPELVGRIPVAAENRLVAAERIAHPECIVDQYMELPSRQSAMQQKI